MFAWAYLSTHLNLVAKDLSGCCITSLPHRKGGNLLAFCFVLEWEGFEVEKFVGLLSGEIFFLECLVKNNPRHFLP